MAAAVAIADVLGVDETSLKNAFCDAKLPIRKPNNSDPPELNGHRSQSGNTTNACYFDAAITALVGSGSVTFMKAAASLEDGVYKAALKLVVNFIRDGGSSSAVSEAVQMLRGVVMNDQNRQNSSSEFITKLFEKFLDVDVVRTMQPTVLVNKRKIVVIPKIMRKAPIFSITENQSAGQVNIDKFVQGETPFEVTSLDKNDENELMAKCMFDSTGHIGNNVARPETVVSLESSDTLILMFERLWGGKRHNTKIEAPYAIRVAGKYMRLASAVVHKGGANSGHYTCFVRNGIQWRHYDDLMESVSEVTDEKAETSIKENGTVFIYVLIHDVYKSTWHERAALAKALFKTYKEGHAPPRWSIGALKDEGLLKSVVCYHAPENMERVTRVLWCRQPVNITYKRAFDECAAYSLFSEHDEARRSQSGYTSLTLKYRPDGQFITPPQIAVYTQTPVGTLSGTRVHIIHSVGLSFDSKLQPDYMRIEAIDISRRKEAVKTHLTGMFQMVLQCAKSQNISKIAIAYVGGGAFAPPDNFLGAAYRDIFVQAVQTVFAPESENGRKLIGLIGAERENALYTKLLSIYDDKFRKLGDVPGVLADTDVLYQNAWDPHSVVGNGNGMDSSLDGWVGRLTAAGVLALPLTNPFIKYESVNSV